MTAQLHRHLLKLHKAAKIENGPGLLPLDITEIDMALGAGRMRGALHEIAAAGEAHLAAVTGFALGIASLPSSWSGSCRTSSVLWISENMALAENGALHGAGFDALGFPPERLVSVSATRRRDLLWAMEEALRCRAARAVIGELRTGGIDSIAVRGFPCRRGKRRTGIVLRATPPPTPPPPPPAGSLARRHRRRRCTRPRARHAFAAQLIRNRRGPLGSWILQWSDDDGVSCSQRMLSLWLRRLSTDRIANIARGLVMSLVVYGKRGNADVLSRSMPRRNGLACRPAWRWRRRAPCIPRIEACRKSQARRRTARQPSPTGASATRRWWRAMARRLAARHLGCAHLFGGEEALVADLGAS